MKTTIAAERMFVVSDIHIGNRLFNARESFLSFLEFVLDSDFNLVINGDGVDIMQSTISSVTRDFSRTMNILKKISDKGRNVFYVVGNHDIVLEHFLADWEILQVVPFLNVLSGDKRIRIEHGHLYDTVFVRYPALYTLTTLFGGMLLRIHPSLYKVMNGAMENSLEFLFSLGEPKGEGQRIPGEDPSYRKMAEWIAKRGFDNVIFGHTHLAGRVPLPGGAEYINTGCWLFDSHYVEINNGSVTLHRVTGNGFTVGE